MSIKIW